MDLRLHKVLVSQTTDLLLQWDYFEKFMERLLQKKYIQNDELNEVYKEGADWKKVTRLYVIVTAKKDRFEESVADALEAMLGKCVLKNVFSHYFENLDVLLGKKLRLKELIPNEKWPKILENLKTSMSRNDVFSFIHDTNFLNDTIELISDTVPPGSPVYKPRRLVKRVGIDPKVFTVDSLDVFVFTGLCMSKLKVLLGHELVEPSSDQLLGRTSRFILLDENTHWKELCENSRDTIHLLKFDSTSNVFFLQNTTGGSTLIHHYLTTTSYSPEVCKPEGELLFDYQDTRCVCICDSPGMGKSWLLAKLARVAKQKFSNKIVAYFSLANFSSFIKQNLHMWTINWSIDILVKHLAILRTTRLILAQILLEKCIELELFFDGLDEVPMQDRELVIMFIEEIMITTNCRIFLTSRKHLRHQMEKLVGQVAYEFEPFEEKLQIQFLALQWTHTFTTLNKEKLRDYATSCIKTLNSNIQFVGSMPKNSIAGIPLLCRLLSDLLAEGAIGFASSEKLEYRNNILGSLSLHHIYHMFILQKLGQSSCHMKCLTRDAQLQNRCNQDCKILTLHVGYSLQAVIPEFVMEAGNYIRVSDITEEDILRPGILEKCHENKQCGLVFVHTTFAEYFVATFFAHAILHEGPKTKLCQTALKFLLHKLLNCFTNQSNNANLSESFSFVDQEFEYKTVINYLNSVLLESNMLSKITPEMFSFLEPLTPSHLYGILCACVEKNYWGILQFLIKCTSGFGIFTIYTYRSYLNVMIGGFSRAANLLMKTTWFCDTKTIKNVFRYLEYELGINLSEQCQRIPLDKLTPVDVGGIRCEAEIVDFFLESSSLEGRHMLFYCAAYTYTLNRERLEARLEIASNLLHKCTNLVYDSYLPLLAPRIHLRMIKLLVTSGADIRVCRDSMNIVHVAAEYMTQVEFLELCDLLVVVLNAQDLFEEKPSWYNPIWYIVLNVQDLNKDGLVKVLTPLKIYSNQESVLSKYIEFTKLEHVPIAKIRIFLLENGRFYLSYNEIHSLIMCKMVGHRDTIISMTDIRF